MVGREFVELLGQPQEGENVAAPLNHLLLAEQFLEKPLDIHLALLYLPGLVVEQAGGLDELVLDDDALGLGELLQPQQL